jgi:DNA-binding PadR family transcriptional regulator
MTDTPLLPGVTTVLRHLSAGPASGFEVRRAAQLTGDTVNRALGRAVREGWATCTEGRVGPWGPRRTYTITDAGRDQIARHDQTTEDQ